MINFLINIKKLTLYRNFKPLVTVDIVHKYLVLLKVTISVLEYNIY